MKLFGKVISISDAGDDINDVQEGTEGEGTEEAKAVKKPKKGIPPMVIKVAKGIAAIVAGVFCIKLGWRAHETFESIVSEAAEQAAPAIAEAVPEVTEAVVDAADEAPVAEVAEQVIDAVNTYSES